MATQTIPEEDQKPYDVQMLEEYTLKQEEMDLKLAFGLYNRDIYSFEHLFPRMTPQLNVFSEDLSAHNDPIPTASVSQTTEGFRSSARSHVGVAVNGPNKWKSREDFLNFHSGRNKQFSNLAMEVTPSLRLKTADIIVGQRYSSENIFENDKEEDESEYKSKVATNTT
jgi:hypothetical protein